MNANRLINMVMRHAMRFVTRRMSRGQPLDPKITKATKAVRMARRVGKF